MTEPPEGVEPPPSEPRPPEASTGQGCIYGGLATVVTLVILPIVITALVAAIPSGQGRNIGAGIFGLVPIGLLVAAGIYWRKIPGFLLGIGLSISIALVIFTGCIALIASLSA
jgi:hypothetical protein